MEIIEIKGFDKDGEPELRIDQDSGSLILVFNFMPPLNNDESSDYNDLFSGEFTKFLSKSIKKKIIQDDRETFILNDYDQKDIETIKSILENFWSYHASVEMARLSFKDYNYPKAFHELKKINEFPKTVRQACLGTQNGGYHALKFIPELLEDLKGINIHPDETIEILPDGILCCQNLEKITIWNMTNLDIFGLIEQLKKLPKLKALDIWRSKVSEIPDNIVELKSLKELGLHETGITNLNLSIIDMPKLKELSIWKENNLKYSLVTRFRKKTKGKIHVFYNN